MITTQPTEDAFVTMKDAADELGVSISAVQNALNEGRLAFAVAFGRRVVSRADLESYKQRTRPGGEKPKGRPRKQAT